MSKRDQKEFTCHTNSSRDSRQKIVIKYSTEKVNVDIFTLPIVSWVAPSGLNIYYPVNTSVGASALWVFNFPMPSLHVNC